MDDPVDTWIEALLLALHEVLLEANPRLNKNALWQALDEEVRPQLEKQRTYVFFTLGSDPEKLDVKKVAKSLFLESQRREKRGAEATQVIPVDAREVPPDESPLPVLNDDTLIEDIRELTVDDIDFTE